MSEKENNINPEDKKQKDDHQESNKKEKISKRKMKINIKIVYSKVLESNVESMQKIGMKIFILVENYFHHVKNI